MRLKLIKLAGFKSFVDPTTVPYPDNLSAIVGPNGCGKSNIIDAVRWVMGESSAKNLRGDAMTDVIFNGSSARKPVGQASVELVFDNTEGKLQGEYASYNELSIRRTVTREAQSTYYLNGTRCRRKDITDIFLGTGLGPRSYAIIEQGMISRLIESKPQELRVFIEEAAGISKYKERRRETENRIRHTRENLDRLGDIREELGKQLAHLQRQAAAAEKYKTFKAEERILKAELAGIRWQSLNTQVEELDQRIRNLTVELEARAAEQQHVDTQIEIRRESQIESNDKFNEVQGRYYGIGATISRLEQDLLHRSERKIQLNQDYQRTVLSLENASQHQLSDKEKITLLQAELTTLEPEYSSVKGQAETSASKLSESDSRMNQWQQEWDLFNQKASENSQLTEIQKTKIQHSENLLDRLTHKNNEIESEKENLINNAENVNLSEISDELEMLTAEVDELTALVDSQKQTLAEQRIKRDELQSNLQQQLHLLQQLEGKSVSLNAMQQAALGKSSKHISRWLETNGLTDAPRIAEKLSVNPGWEKAVETVLGDSLQAVVVDSLENSTEWLKDFNKGMLTIVESAESPFSESTQKNFTALTTQVKGDNSYKKLLNNVFIADDIFQALSMRKDLEPSQSVVTKEGVWIGDNWLKISREEDSETGVIEREREIKLLNEKLIVQTETVSELQQQLQQCREQVSAVEEQWQNSQSQLVQKNKTVSEKNSHLQSIKSSMQHTQQQIARLQKEFDDNANRKTEEQDKIAESRIQLEQSLEKMANDQSTRSELLDIREQRRAHLIHVRERAREDKDLVHKLALRSESIKTELTSTENSLQRSISQVEESSERLETLKLQMEQNIEPVAEKQASLEESLQQHLSVEEELKQARIQLDDCEQQLRNLEKQRLQFEQNHEAVRRKIESENLAKQAHTIQRENQLQILKESNHDLEQVLKNLAEDSHEEDWSQRIAKIGFKVERLGAINLAAIEEYDTQSERKIYLDAQDEDLTEALETLESAIRKIDKETRTKFKDTFDKINKGIQELFPKVFGGGHAYLELTGEDLLDTGVAIMARPPGKRNSTIHLLSGGEKAMTAIALVFAIFHLNPAPFCMLDEVDAPLDDANVGRYCRLVEEMSKKIQFIYISHNKQAMEMAHALVGVTMQEPGVSRMVSVDIDEASALAAS
jgi:chromosome segregation protein